MIETASDSFTVSLGPLAQFARRKVEAGEYETLDAVLREGLRALEREERALDKLIEAKARIALADPRPSLTTEEVFSSLERYHEQRKRNEL